MLKDYGIMTLCDLIFVGCLAGFLFRNVGPTYDCSKKLFGVGLGYFLF